MDKLVPTLKYLAFLVAFTVLAAELLLRIFNPIPFRVKGDKIILPKNQKIVINNDLIPTLDPVIYHTKNRLGFRGPEPPANLNEVISLVAIGGSTTECYYISDSLTWPYQVGQKLEKDFSDIWMNNAGLDGHSTYGHKVLLDDYILAIKPKYVLFLIGCNDVEREDLHHTDQMQRGLDRIVERKNNLLQFFLNHSELVSLLDNIRRANRAKQRNLMHEDLSPRLRNNDTLFLDQSEVNNVLQKQQPYLESFSHRATELIKLCRDNDIEPILLTQPSLFGKGIDDRTGGDLEKTRLNDGTNGKLYWQRLELYNDVVREIARSNDIYLIDLATIIPKSSQYFYDTVHFTNEGSSYVSQVIYEHLSRFIKNQNIN